MGDGEAPDAVVRPAGGAELVVVEVQVLQVVRADWKA